MFSQIDDRQAYPTSGGRPYTGAQLVRMAYNLSFQSGKMKEACRDWRKHQHVYQTRPNFVTDFKAAHLDLQHRATSKSSGFQAHFAEQAQITE